MTRREVRTMFQSFFGFGDFSPMQDRKRRPAQCDSELSRMNRAALALQVEADALKTKKESEAFGRTLEQVAQDL